MLRNVFIGQKVGSFIHDKVIGYEFEIERTTKEGHHCRCSKRAFDADRKHHYGDEAFIPFSLHGDFHKGKFKP
jgi:hypothetical protein